MHQLVPEFILENMRRNRLQGFVTGSALFIDISGFTKVTEALLAHGQYGAEVLADIMRTIFTPLVQSVYEQGGFVTGFAGDAITAVFPHLDYQANHAQRALAAAVRMQEHMAANREQVTRLGTFPFSAKVGLAAGQTTWGILSDPQERRATYYFKGEPIDASSAAEQLAQSGEIMADISIFSALREHVSATAVEGRWLITELLSSPPQIQDIILPAVDVEQLTRFFPRALVEQVIQGEFRQVLNVFIGLQGAPTHSQLVAFMHHFFRLQEQYEGLLNRIDFGDKGCGLLLFWGAPISYENDLTRALDFVLALQGASEIPLRTGITYRIAHAGYIGSPLAEEFTCYGRGVNLAARYMTAAGWGEIWLDEEVARRARAEYRLHELGEQTLKGFAQAQPVWLLLRKREQVPILEERPFFGRAEELQLLGEALQPLFDGKFAGVVTVLGEAGIGKSRLVHTLLEPLTEDGRTTVFVCQADEILRQSLNPFRSFLHTYFDQSSNRDESANKERFEERLQELLDHVPNAVLQEEIRRTWSFLGSMVGLSWPGSLYEQLEPELRYENTLDGLKALFKAESLRRPVIVLMEDGHWLDQDSAAFLARLTRNVSEFPFTVLVTTREALDVDTFDADAPQMTLEMQALNDDVVSELAASILDHPPSPQLIRLLGERTEGNPFFIEQVLLYMQENDLLDVVETGVGQAANVGVYIPTDVRAVLTARLDRLSPLVKDVVQKAAVLGREFETPILAHMMDHDPELEPSLATATAESVWYTLDEVRYLFKHALLRDAAYDMQVQARRRQLHALAAEAFETEQQIEGARPPRHATIAYHFDRAEMADRARQHYGAAAEQAKSDYRNEDAISYYSRALELVRESDVEEKVRLLNGRETIFQWLGFRRQQQQDLLLLSQLLAEHPDDLLLSDLALRQSSYAVVTGDYRAAIEKAEVALRHARDAHDTQAAAKAYHRWGRTLWQQGEAEQAKQVLDNALKLARAEKIRSLEADCLADLANAHRLLTDYRRAQRYLEKATISYEVVQDEQGQVRCYNLFGVIDYDLGHYAESEQYYVRALNLCREIGWRYAETHVLLNLGNTQFDLGSYDKGRAYLEQAVPLAQELGDTRSHAVSLDTLGLIAHYTDHPDEAVQIYSEARDMLRAIHNGRELGFVLTHMGYAQLDSGSFVEAEENLQTAFNLRMELGLKALGIDALGGLAATAMVTGRLERARALTAEIVAYLDEEGVDGIELPILVYLTCYRVLQASAEADEEARLQAEKLLEDGYTLLAKRVRRLHDDEMRTRFLEEVPYNRALRDLWLATQS